MENIWIRNLNGNIITCESLLLCFKEIKTFFSRFPAVQLILWELRDEIKTLKSPLNSGKKGNKRKTTTEIFLKISLCSAVWYAPYLTSCYYAHTNRVLGHVLDTKLGMLNILLSGLVFTTLFRFKLQFTTAHRDGLYRNAKHRCLCV